MQDKKIISEKTVYEDHLHVQEGEIRGPRGTYTRTRLKRPAGSAVLIYNAEDDSMVLTKQFRYALHSETSEEILEIPAGVLDKGEDPLKAACRETEEEVGYRIEIASLKPIGDCFVTPGYSSEILHHYYAEVKNSDRIKKGGGLKEEHEDIQIVHLKRGEFEEKIKKREIRDAKTLMAGYWFLLNISPGLSH